MIPVKQTIRGTGNGNCLAACIASLLHCSIEEIPELTGNESQSEQDFVLNQWLRKKGLQLVRFEIPRNQAIEFFTVAEDFYYVQYVRTLPDEGHAAIGKNGEIIFDPSGYPLNLLNNYASLFSTMILAVLVPLRPWEVFKDREPRETGE